MSESENSCNGSCNGGCQNKCKSTDKILFKRDIPECIGDTTISKTSDIRDIILWILVKICSILSQLRSINTILSKDNAVFCPNLNQFYYSCKLQGLRIISFEKSTDNGATFVSLGINGKTLEEAIVVLNENGIIFNKVEGGYIISYLECKDIKFKFGFDCIGQDNIPKLSVFNIPNCPGQNIKVATARVNDNILEFEGALLSPTIESELLNLGLYKVGDSYIYYGTDIMNFYFICEDMQTFKFSLPINCGDGNGTILVPSGALKKNGIAQNYNSTTHISIYSLLSYLQTYSSLWVISGGGVEITDVNEWSLDIDCIGGNSGDGIVENCTICAIYNGSLQGVSLDVQYKVNSGATILINLTPDSCIVVAQGSNIEIVSQIPLGGSIIDDWTLINENCGIVS